MCTKAALRSKSAKSLNWINSRWWLNPFDERRVPQKENPPQPQIGAHKSRRNKLKPTPRKRVVVSKRETWHTWQLHITLSLIGMGAWFWSAKKNLKQKNDQWVQQAFLTTAVLVVYQLFFFVPPSPLAEVLPNDPPHSLSSSAPMEEATPNVKTTGRFRDLKNSMAQHGTTIYDNNSKKQKSWFWMVLGYWESSSLDPSYSIVKDFSTFSFVNGLSWFWWYVVGNMQPPRRLYLYMHIYITGT